jgi:hypothetical protein
LFQIFLFAGIAVSLLLAVLEIGWPSIEPVAVGIRVKPVLVVLAATLPGVAAFFAISAEKRAYEPHYRSYRMMGALFAQAREEAERIPSANAGEFQELMHDLGREALAENAAWLLDHRHRPIKHQ